MTISAARRLRDDMRLGGITQDPFTEGAVLRWKVNGNLTYAAIKTPVGWFTTARDHNVYVRQTYRYMDLVRMLVKREVTDLEVSTEWRKVR